MSFLRTQASTLGSQVSFLGAQVSFPGAKLSLLESGEFPGIRRVLATCVLLGSEATVVLKRMGMGL